MKNNLKTNTKVKNIIINKTATNKEAMSLARKAKKTVEKAAEKIPAVVSFILVSKIKLCFRECAAIVKVAEDTGCLIEIASGTKSGTSDSILSLVNLAVTADKSLVLTIHGENNHEAFNRVSNIISGKESDS